MSAFVPRGARIGSVVVVGILGVVGYSVVLYLELCDSTAREYEARRLALIQRAVSKEDG